MIKKNCFNTNGRTAVAISIIHSVRTKLAVKQRTQVELKMSRVE
jgi:hypothetical protein